MDDAAVVHDRHIVADRLSDAKILLDEKDRGVFAFEPQQGLDQLIDHCRRQSFGRLVDQQQPALLDHGAADRQHLFLSAGQRACRRIPFHFQRREAFQHAIEVFRREAAPLGGEQHVFAHRQFAEDAHILRHVSDAEAGDMRRVERGDRLAVENDLAEPRLPQAHDGAQRRGLAGAVSPQQGGDASARRAEVDAVQNPITADIGENALDPQ